MARNTIDVTVPVPRFEPCRQSMGENRFSEGYEFRWITRFWKYECDEI